MDVKIPVEITGDEYDFPILSIIAVSGTDTLIIDHSSNKDFIDQDKILDKTSKNWSYDKNRRIVTYNKKIRLIKETISEDEGTSTLICTIIYYIYQPVNRKS